jgi:hypothetical protein
MLISKLIKCPFLRPIAPVYSAQLCFQVLQIWPFTFNLVFLGMKVNILFFKYIGVHVPVIENILEISNWDCSCIAYCEAFS